MIAKFKQEDFKNWMNLKKISFTGANVHRYLNNLYVIESNMFGFVNSYNNKNHYIENDCEYHKNTAIYYLKLLKESPDVWDQFVIIDEN